MVCQGVAEASGGRPVARNTVFGVASVTKTMTAIGPMHRQQAGCSGLMVNPVNDYLSAFQIQPPPGKAAQAAGACRVLTCRPMVPSAAPPWATRAES